MWVIKLVLTIKKQYFKSVKADPIYFSPSCDLNISSYELILRVNEGHKNIL